MTAPRQPLLRLVAMVPPQHDKALAEEAARLGSSKASVVRRLIADFVDVRKRGGLEAT